MTGEGAFARVLNDVTTRFELARTLQQTMLVITWRLLLNAGLYFGEFIARFQKSGTFWKRLATNILVLRFGEFLAIFWKHLAPNFLVRRKVRPVYLYVFAYIFICRFTIFKLADDLKIHDIKLTYESFESRSIVLSTSYQICLQNVEADHSEIFPKCSKNL